MMERTRLIAEAHGFLLQGIKVVDPAENEPYIEDLTVGVRTSSGWHYIDINWFADEAFDVFNNTLLKDGKLCRTV